MTTEYQFQEMCHKMVHNEVHHTISNLVYTLAKSYGSVDSRDRDLSDLVEQAYELSRPIEDWEEAALQAGYVVAEGGPYIVGPDGAFVSDDEGTIDPTMDDAWRSVCEANEIEPYEREIYEHWIVSNWLAEKLKAKGERVDDDFAGMTVWARTTTGQAISMDYVIRQITRELHNLEIKD